MTCYDETNCTYYNYNKRISEKLDESIVKHFTHYYNKNPLPFIKNLNFYKILKLKNRINIHLNVLCFSSFFFCFFFFLPYPGVPSRGLYWNITLYILMKNTKIKKNTINKLKQRTLRSFDHLSEDKGKKVHI